ncbi:MAG TPA: carbohydrate-binding protein, partial [Bacteroidetes bacterium]|nr:carbohydrate-binding protein [Bacteroidota bacterium]
QIRQKIEDLAGIENTQIFYDEWLKNFVTKTDIDSLHSWGFNCVRVPIHYNLFTLPIEKEPNPSENTWLEKGFLMIDTLADWCRENNIYIILDLHAAPGGQGHDEGISDYDPDKPSLWESKSNRDKTVSLWKKLAQRYAQDTIFAGYDLLNEPNWELPGNTLLKNLYKQITDSIRTVDNNHILFIEGNWFANDFTGLLQPWDDKIVYAPHKYWNYNDKQFIDWILNIRDVSNAPVIVGESGENSNAWYTETIKLLEQNEIGWAWWTLKKVESISSPLWINKSQNYNRLLNYWKGFTSKPGQEFVLSTLQELIEVIKIQNCVYHKDVIDAMFRQVNSDNTIPYSANNIPGIIYCTDFDLGTQGIAYNDIGYADFHLSTNVFTSWNQGWIYRNDGVDIQKCEDTLNSNGYNVSWTDKDEWMIYSVFIDSVAIYNINIRTAAGDYGGQFSLQLDNEDITRNYYVPYTGDYQSWQTTTVENVVLPSGNHKLKLKINGPGANYNSMQFLKTGETSEINTLFISATTVDKNTIKINFNKPVSNDILDNFNDIKLLINNENSSLSNPIIDSLNHAVVYINIDRNINFKDKLRIKYFGTKIHGEDGTILESFNWTDVKNTLELYFTIPGKIEAEDFYSQNGIVLENCTDQGGGKDIGYLDVGDNIDYKINIEKEGNYNVVFRIASLGYNGGLKMFLISENGDKQEVLNTSFSPTGGWQAWKSFESSAYLPKGEYILRLVITKPQFNINWFRFDFISRTQQTYKELATLIYPNPFNDYIFINNEVNTDID